MKGHKYLVLIVLLIALFACHKNPPPSEPPCNNNGVCETGETIAYCNDCKVAPWKPLDGKCERVKGENEVNSPSDCKLTGPVCGDGDCEAPENSSNCLKDCPTTWKPRDHKCEKGKGENKINSPEDCAGPPAEVCGDESLDPDCPKITRNFDRFELIGLYTVLTSDPDFDAEAAFKLFKKANGTSFHVLTPWDKHDRTWWPYAFDGKKYDLLKWNELWWAKLKFLLRAHAYYDLAAHLVLFDGYGGQKWMDNYGVDKYHPFTQNVQGKNLNGSDGEGLYGNDASAGFKDPKDFAWLSYTKDTGPFSAPNKAGRGVMAYVERIADLCKEVRGEFPNFRLFITASNEPQAECDPPRDACTHPNQGKRSMDDRIDEYVLQTFKSRGFLPGSNYRFIYTQQAQNAGKGEGINLCWLAKTHRMWTSKNKTLQEIHSVDNVSIAKKYLGAVPSSGLFLSSDGTPEDGGYFKNMKAIRALNVEYFDYKLWGCYKKGTDCPNPWNTNNMNECVETFVPRMEKEIWK